MALSKYKLTEAGQAYLKAANDKEQPHKGIILSNKVKGGRVDIRTITDEQAKELHEAGSAYVEPVKSGGS